MTPKEVLALCRRAEIRAVDLRFMDFPGTQKHFTIPVKELTEDSFAEGFTIDGSSIRGWQAINESDMLVVPQAETAYVDPFHQSTLVMTCNIQEPITREDYAKDPRNVARKAERYMLSTGIADVASFGVQSEFFIFDNVRFDQNDHEGYYHIDSIEGEWNRGAPQQGTNAGYKIRKKQGYLPIPPSDTLQDLRTEIMLALQECGVDVGAQYHEVATAGQCEIDLKYGPLVRSADHLLRMKYIVKNVAARHGKSATFMPKPLWNDNGSGLHLHLSLWKANQPLFAGSGYGGLSETALYALGGILKHAPALMAFCCPTTNSYKRLVPGFEAPINLTYSFRNRSAAVRIPVHKSRPGNKRFEFRCPDASSNGYLAMASILMAALDGIQRQIDPGPPLDKDIYDLRPSELEAFPKVPASLEESLAALREDHQFLLRGDVFTEDVIDTWIWYKQTQEVDAIRERPHPWEFAMYYDI
ncbi:type I glutamate--ammonia ligase [Planctomyces sp. SH-PL14]|uniref:type I glutamate--ammonia ligase n=1 Tax=Planctomyces sp. SH-PL14 TaxID=1632864 RepID=UPI00078C4B82|nr:type I glutamate--ammonia ligase [Planctomyces sp. SH-PL14]AMV16898.1 Glutamine synthetase [Planctomyces sp. SH-PL14]